MAGENSTQDEQKTPQLVTRQTVLKLVFCPVNPHQGTCTFILRFHFTCLSPATLTFK